MDDDLTIINEIVDLFKNPLNDNNYTPNAKKKKIFLEPVLAEDGETYELTELAHWFIKHDKSPKTGSPMKKGFTEIIPLRSFIAEIADYDPKIKAKQYKIKKSINNNSYYMNRSKIYSFIQKAQYEELLNYKEYSLQDLETSRVITIIQYAPYNVIEYLFKNCIDIHERFDLDYPGSSYRGYRLSNLVARFGSKDAKIYIISNNIDIDSVSEGGNHFVWHLIQNTSEPNVIKLMAEKNIKDFIRTDLGGDRTVIEYLMKHTNLPFDTFQYIFELMKQHKIKLSGSIRSDLKNRIHTKKGYWTSEQQNSLVNIIEILKS